MEIDYNNSVINEDGNVSIVGIINNKNFKLNVSFGRGFVFDEYNNLTDKEQTTIIYEYQDTIL